MSNARTEQRIWDLEDLHYTYLQHIIDIAVQHSKNVVSDALGGGLIDLVVQQTAPASMYARTAMLGYSKSGDKMIITGLQDIDCSEDYLGNATVPGSGYCWISCFAVPLWELGEQRADGRGQQKFHTRTEDVELRIYKGTSTTLPISPGSGAIRIWSVRLYKTTTSLLNADFRYTENYAEWMYPLNLRLPLSGGTMTGPLFFRMPFGEETTQDYPATACAHGEFSFPATYSPIGDVGMDDFNYHYVLAGPLIDLGPGFEGYTFHVAADFKIIYFSQTGPIPIWLNPIRMRNLTDFPASPNQDKLTEGIMVYYEEDDDGKFTGRFQIFLIGMDTFLSRFCDKPVRWMAFRAVSDNDYIL